MATPNPGLYTLPPPPERLTYLMKSGGTAAEQFDSQVVDFLVEHGYAEHDLTLTYPMRDGSDVKIHYYKPKEK